MNRPNMTRKEALTLATSILSDLAARETLKFGSDQVERRLTYSEVISGRHVLARTAELEIEARKRRNLYVFSKLLGEPAWDILLDMFICWAEGRPIKMKDAVLASKAPEATAHRYICTMAEKGLVRRSKNSRDGRVVSIELTEEVVIELGTYLARST